MIKSKKKAICFGAAGNGKRLCSSIREKYQILAYTDNDSNKWGGQIQDINILPVDVCLKLDYDIVVITSAPGLETIYRQLLREGIEEWSIDTSFVALPLESRKNFLEKLSIIQKNFPLEYQVAEAGVFEGDFAKWINHYYSERELHLFDTFEGFSEIDIMKECDLSNANVGDYSNTTIELVMEKMICPQNVKIHKGYFPESAKDIEGKFCFVNLDLDLYEPTYNGLVFFCEKMVSGGVILVHDYFSETYNGPKEAVDKFIKEYDRKYTKYPIGDGISVMIVGF